MGRTPNATSKTAAKLLGFCWLTKFNGTFTKFCFWNLLITNETGGRVLQNKPYFCRPYCTALHVNSCPRRDFWYFCLVHSLSGDGIADIVADRYFNWGRQTNSQVIVSGVPSRHEKKIGTPDRRLLPLKTRAHARKTKVYMACSRAHMLVTCLIACLSYGTSLLTVTCPCKN